MNPLMFGKLFHGIGLGLLLILTMLLLYTNADFFFGDYAGIYKNDLLTHLILITVITAVLNVRLPTLNIGVYGLASFAGMFLITSLLLNFIDTKLIQGLIGASTVPLSVSILVAFLFAWSEEVVFRALLPKAAGLGNILSNIIFGVFHLWATYVRTNGNIMLALASMTVLGILGWAWSWIARNPKFGVFGSTGSHFAWNLKAFGMLARIVGGV